MDYRRARLFAFLLALSLLGAAPAPPTFTSGARRVTLLELFTSEGCSSCPPAESWFSRLMEEPALWTGFVPVAFHVDYWDELGWPDPLSFPGATARQRAYARAWGAHTVYTPDVVRGGTDWADWRAAAGDSLAPASPSKAGVLQAQPSPDGSVKVTFRPEDGDGGEWTAEAALLGFGIVSSVKAGENAGRTLRHDFAVLGYAVAGLKRDGKVLSGTLRVADTTKLQPRRLGLAVWVVRRGDTEPAQAVGGYLPEKIR